MLQVQNDQALREENAKLRRIVSELEETIIQLREVLLPPEWEPPIEIGLTKTEARIVATLFKQKGEVVTKEQLFYTLCYDKLEQPEIKIVDVMVCKTRKKLEPYGLRIETVWSRGYLLDAPSIDILKSWGIDPNETSAN